MMTKYRVQIKMIRKVQIEVELPEESTSWLIEGTAMQKAIEKYGVYDDYEAWDFEKVTP